MNRIEFLKRLRERLDALAIGDVDEIVSQYEEHFAYKQADGYSEEEVAAKLGSPEQLAAQFATAGEGKRPGGSKALTVLGLVFTDLFAGMFFVVLYAWTAAVAVLSIASAVLGACLLAGFNPYSLIPGLPYGCALLMAGSLIALGVLSAVGCLYFGAFTRRLARAYGRYRRNLLAAASGRAIAPPVSPQPFFPARVNRRLRRIAWVSLCAFAVGFVAGYIACAASAGALEFWHAWGWFVQ
ncbi:MAG: DUF1700 domain-containing protein [Clostridiales bacterium]|nr:DUF1700 domain-containing protein [Clostridiales bacterium]OPZ68856.1 MAG: hypothetical protein BWY81_00697 [Firmicutes bacterium ADurb.Bin467]